MDKTVPVPAAYLLAVIGQVETGGSYNTVYGHNEKKLTKQITSMTVDELIGYMPGFSKSFGSSASGRYQFMEATLRGLKRELGLRGTQIFDPNLQDRLGYHLLLRRGYDKWVRGQITDHEFMIALAKEWASFPVPYRMRGSRAMVDRGETYYAGDGLNKALILPATVEAHLAKALVMKGTIPDPAPAVVVEKEPRPVVEQFWAWVFRGFRRA